MNYAPSPGIELSPYRPGPPPGPEPHRVRALAAIKFGLQPPGGMATIFIGLVHLFIPIVGQIAFHGYQAELVTRLAKRDPNLPALRFDDFSANISRGVAPFVVQLVVMVPFFMIGLPLMAVPIVIRASMTRGSAPDPLMGLFFAGLMGCGALAFLVAYPFFNAAITRADLTGNIGVALRPREVFVLGKRTFWMCLGASFVYGLLSVLLMIGGVLVFLVGIYVASVVVQIGLSHLRWQIYERYVTSGGPHVPMKSAAQPRAHYSTLP